jgi:hypothetical protein
MSIQLQNRIGDILNSIKFAKTIPIVKTVGFGISKVALLNTQKVMYRIEVCFEKLFIASKMLIVI